jgi:hypothetical protein
MAGHSGSYLYSQLCGEAQIGGSCGAGQPGALKQINDGRVQLTLKLPHSHTTESIRSHHVSHEIKLKGWLPSNQVGVPIPLWLTKQIRLYKGTLSTDCYNKQFYGVCETHTCAYMGYENKKGTTAPTAHSLAPEAEGKRNSQTTVLLSISVSGNLSSCPHFHL